VPWLCAAVRILMRKVDELEKTQCRQQTELDPAPKDFKMTGQQRHGRKTRKTKGTKEDRDNEESRQTVSGVSLCSPYSGGHGAELETIVSKGGDDVDDNGEIEKYLEEIHKGQGSIVIVEKENQADRVSPAPSTAHFEDGEFLVRYAKSSRSICKKCSENILEGALRIGKMTPSDKIVGMVPVWHSDKNVGMVPVWQHAQCFLKGDRLPKSTALIDGFAALQSAARVFIAEFVPHVEATESGVFWASLSEESRRPFGSEMPEYVVAQHRNVNGVFERLGSSVDTQLVVQMSLAGAKLLRNLKEILDKHGQQLKRIPVAQVEPLFDELSGVLYREIAS